MNEREKLAEISHILETIETKTITEKNKRTGRTSTMVVDITNDAYYALEAVIQELRKIIKQEEESPGEGELPDMIQVRTLENVQMRIGEVMRIAQEYRTKPGFHTIREHSHEEQSIQTPSDPEAHEPPAEGGSEPTL